MNISNKSNSDEIISNLTSIDFVVLAAMHDTDLKTMIKINALELVKSCEKFFELEIMQKMNHEPSPELKMKIQNWLVSIEYKQYTQNTSNNSTKLKEEIDKCSKIIPIMFTIGIANTRLFSEMFKTMNLSMYNYLSKNKNIHPIFLDYLK